MPDRPTDLSSLPSYQSPRRSLFSARKFALMASVVAGLGVLGPTRMDYPTAMATVRAVARYVSELLAP